MRKLERITIALFVLLLAVFAGIRVYGRFFTDRTAPVISCPTGILEISVRDGESVLLDGMTAHDDRDGDVTADIRVNSVSHLRADNTAKVTYLVFDEAQNTASCTRVIRYTDYEKPEFALSKPLTFRVGEIISLTDRLSAHDILDGDISGSIRVTVKNLTLLYEGIYSVTVQVTNSMGDTASLPLTVVISNSAAGNPLIDLSRYICYVKQGSAFDPLSLVEAVRGADGSPLDPSRLTVASDVDTGTAGNYAVSYTLEDGGQTYTAYLTVVVK